MFRIAIVDPSPVGYEQLATKEFAEAASITQVRTAGEALRLQLTGCVDFWLVARELGDLSGIELLEMLHERTPRARIALVGETYSQDDEIAALALGASAYLSKPLDLGWLRHWSHETAGVAANEWR